VTLNVFSSDISCCDISINESKREIICILNDLDSIYNNLTLTYFVKMKKNI